MKEQRIYSAYFLERTEECPETLDTHSGDDFYYLPEGKEVPRDCDGSKMSLLFQVNFSQLPKLEGFADLEIMRIFTSNDYGAMESSGIYTNDDIRVEFYKTEEFGAVVDFINSDFGAFGNEEEIMERICHDVEQDGRFVFVQGKKYIGTGATMHLCGNDIKVPLGGRDFDGVIVGGLVTAGELYGKNLNLFENNPEYSYPLLRINSSENGIGDIFEAYWFFVKPEEFARREIKSVMLLIISDID